MATGKKAFEGKTQASLMAKILEIDPPPMSSLTPMMPPQLDRVVKTCMAKEPDERWQAASDLCRELKWIAEGGSQTALPAVASLGRARTLRRWALVGGLACLVVVGVALRSLLRTPPTFALRTARLAMTLPATDQMMLGGSFEPVALSARRLARGLSRE